MYMIRLERERFLKEVHPLSLASKYKLDSTTKVRSMSKVRAISYMWHYYRLTML